MAPALRLALALAAAVSQSGCAVGYVLIRPGSDLERGPRTDWSAHRFTVEGEPRDRCAAERVLLERYGVLDVRSGAREEGAFHLAISRAKADRPLEDVLLLLSLASYATFSVIPGYGSSTHDLTFTLQGPDGETFAATGRFEKKWILWLPFLLLAPTRFEYEKDLDRLGAAEALAADFFRSAEAFVAGRGAPAGTSP